MTSQNKLRVLSLATCALMATGTVQAALLDLDGLGYYTYGNTNVYSMPISAYQYAVQTGTGEGPGNPYYVASTPGAIKDLVVIYTGANGTDVTTNTAGFEDAYQTPNGKVDPYASTNGTGIVSPGTKAEINNAYSYTWDASLSALQTFLDGGNPLFLFNNNETNADQNLAIWARLWITDPSNNTVGQILYLSNEGAQYGMGGIPMGDATALVSGGNDPAWAFVDGKLNTDYVLSGGNVCLSTLDHTTIVECGSPDSKTFNHNLGANQVAYAAELPLLNQYLAGLFGTDGINLADYTLHLDLRLGCDPAIAALDPGNQSTICNDLKIDNGFEQLFLASSRAPTVTVPEPGSMALIGLGLVGLSVLRRRRA